MLKDAKSLHCVQHGAAVIVNLDDVLLHKPSTEVFTQEDFMTLPSHHQPPEEDIQEQP